MTRFALFLAFLLAIYPAAHASTDRLGSILGAVSTKGGTTCLEIANPGLRAGSRLTVVYPDHPSPVVTAQITGQDPACTRDPSLIGYALHPVRGAFRPGAAVGALVAESAIDVRNRVAQLRVPGERKPLQLRLCTSADGVHLSAWNETRLWHAYVYAGQDLVPTCRGEETR